MGYKKILIEEKEKQEILSKYYSDNNLVTEQFDKTTGTYTTMYDNTLKKVTNAKDIVIPKGTKVWHNFKGNDTKINLGNTGVYYDCAFAGYENIFTNTKTLGNLKNDNLAKAVRSYFCDGKKVKTWGQITGVKKEVEKQIDKVINKPIKLPDLTYKNFCNLPGDKVWVYAKLDDGTWYASKNKVDWFKLELPKYQKAIDLLTKDAKCFGLEEIPVLKVKELEQIVPEPTNTVQKNVAPDQDNEERPMTA